LDRVFNRQDAKKIILGALASQRFALFNVKVLRLRMMDDDRIRRLFRLDHEFFREFHADPFRLQKLEKLR